MNGSLKFVQAVILLSFAGLFFTSCGGNQTSLASTTTSGTTTVNPTPTSSETTEEEEETNATIPSGYSASNLFVAVTDTIDYLNFSSLAGDHSSRCTFTSASVVNDLTCVIEANELATYFNGVKLQMNVPANQCKYISTYPYWYYNFEIGYGPASATINVTKNASGIVTASSCSVGGSAAQSCTASTDSRFNDVTFDPSDDLNMLCNYDNSNLDGGQNCCLGKYDLTRTETTPDGTTTSFERGKEWGGQVGNCIGGAGKTNWESYNTAGYPLAEIEKMKDDVARTKIITVKGPIQSISYRSNIPVANFFSGGHMHTGFGTASGVVVAATANTPARPSPLPYYVDPISDRSGSLIYPGNPYYRFDCLDEAFETNYRIRVMVQEWDTVAALETYIATGVSSTVGADEPGTAPTDCPGQSGEECNQVEDADDLLTNVGGSYRNGSPSFRGFYFPMHSYE